jgi:hypothetical protein
MLSGTAGAVTGGAAATGAAGAIAEVDRQPEPAASTNPIATSERMAERKGIRHCRIHECAWSGLVVLTWSVTERRAATG